MILTQLNIRWSIPSTPITRSDEIICRPYFRYRARIFLPP
nr:MAG TPA: hypothetical protein [Caudoviricetes sp.]DAN84388.1 MAG TPA: hypothetical protein [Caudoviricetes sp.]